MSSHPLDAMIAAPDHHSVLFENDRVRVLDTRLPAGQRTPVHAHEWPAALYVLGWSDFLRRDADGNILADSRERPPVAPGPACGSIRCRLIRSRISEMPTCTSSPSS